MSANELSRESSRILSKRSLKWAGLAAIVGCATCCALPMLAVVIVGTSAGAAITRFMMPGSEIIVGGATFVATMAVMVARARAKERQGCHVSCRADKDCCDRGAL